MQYTHNWSPNQSLAHPNLVWSSVIAIKWVIVSFDSFFATAEDVIRMSGQKWIVRREFRRHSKMTFAKFWELLTPHPSLSAQSVPHVYKFCVPLDPPLPILFGYHNIWDPLVRLFAFCVMASVGEIEREGESIFSSSSSSHEREMKMMSEDDGVSIAVVASFVFPSSDSVDSV